MTQYIKQRDKFRCGPVAVLNSLRWAGANVSTNYVYELSEKCKTRPFGYGGTSHHDFDRVMRKEGGELFKADLILKPRINEIEEHLKKGGALVLNYAWGKHRHFVLLTEVSETGKTFAMINDFANRPAVVKVRRKTFIERCLMHRNDEDAKAWLLTKV